MQRSAGAMDRWQRRTIIANCNAQRQSILVTWRHFTASSIESWYPRPAAQRIAFLQAPCRRFLLNSDILGSIADIAYSRSGWITEIKYNRLADGVSCRKVLLRAPVFRASFEQTASTWSFQESLSSTMTPRSRELLTCLALIFLLLSFSVQFFVSRSFVAALPFQRL